jgi:Ras-related protein Rab-32
MTDNSENYTQIYNYKVLILGDIGTGKTSIIKRYVDDKFTDGYKSTIGVDFMLKNVQKNINGENIEIRVQLWDISGQERFGNMTSTYYRGAVGVFVVFDVTRMNTYEGACTWKHDVDFKLIFPNGKKVPAVLLGNKQDLLDENMSETLKDNIDKNSKELGFSGWYQTSAKDCTGIEEAADHLISEILAEVGHTNIWDKVPGSFQIDANRSVPIDYDKNDRCKCLLM